MDLCDSDYKRELTIKHMLMMGSGFENREKGIMSMDNPIKEALSVPVLHKPGTVFNYYTLGTYLLSVVFSKVNPEGIHRYLKYNFINE
jgi:CubicO group peptidase (beta-lactamase class C family)